MFFGRRWNRWKALPPEIRGMVWEAVAALLRSRVLVAFALRGAIPQMLQESSQEAIPPAKLVRDVRATIRLASRMVPWKILCLPTAMAAKTMLHRRGFASTLRLGVGKRGDNILHAHAWLEVGGLIVTGHEGIGTVIPLPQQTLLSRNS